MTITRRILITGMSAVGKSTVIDELARRGSKAIDLDTPVWSEYAYLEQEKDPDSSAETDWLWREDRIEELLSSHDAGTVFVAGCAANQGRFYRWFDHVILLTASETVMKSRLSTRTTNEFGKTPAELAKILADKAIFEDRLRAGADAEIDTDTPLDSVVEQILEIAEGTEPQSA